MKKLSFIFVLFITVSTVVSLFSCTAQNPKANLKTPVDSLSYALGADLLYNQGLEQYLDRLGISEKHKADFIKGLQEGFKADTTKKSEYARLVGIGIGQQLAIQQISQLNSGIFGKDSRDAIDKSLFISGLIDGYSGKGIKIDKSEISGFIESTVKQLQDEKNERLKTENQKFLDENKSKEGVVTLPSGLQYKVVTEGTGEKPASAEDTVTVNYIGKTIDGKEFDSNTSKENPATFALNRVIAGWTEGMQLMSAGSKYIFYIPYDLAYGEQGAGQNIAPYSTLIFEVDLLGVSHASAAKEK
ncbi:MAG: FKBP-type peptidyl-prolyl cis-trans isomerase [Dysgonamonadaceae bacterium]|jgi:FKBP-type peptidyl-prolyl cis-trans isomerase FklB|nr:FKBP-type peptidyl-prolyl cis-trans isomerase [Dysgonamonadaceae bacterium]